MRIWPVVAYALVPYAVASLIWRALRYPAYWGRWPERFGFVPALRGHRVVWVHAVSVGEVRSAAALIRAVAKRLPRHRILVTTMTPTGSAQVAELFGRAVLHSYLPYDTPDATARFLERSRPELAIIAETEFWPNLYEACARRRIPLYIVNARLSSASFRGYQRVGRTARRMFRSATGIFAQSTLDAQRFRNLGVEDRLLRVTGNLKFDVEPPASLISRGRTLRAEWGADRAVLIAASTHAGEERRILAAFAELRRRDSALLLVLVPRHPERFSAVVRLSRRFGFATARRSRAAGPLAPEVDVLVGDTVGELPTFYAAADVAIIGGSFVRHGGQNPLEACQAGVPVIFGPHMFHFEEISALLLERGCAQQVADIEALPAAVSLYLEHASLRRAAGDAGLDVMQENAGSLARTLDSIEGQLADIATAPARSAVAASH